MKVLFNKYILTYELIDIYNSDLPTKKQKFSVITDDIYKTIGKITMEVLKDYFVKNIFIEKRKGIYVEKKGEK